MRLVYERCCGLDVHKNLVIACLSTPDALGHPVKQVRTFRTTTADLLALGDWLSAAACTHVAMESTGVYWKPIYNVLADAFEVLVVNAQHIKAATTDSPQWKQGGLDRHGRGDRSDPCVVRPAIAVA
jgi:transposase